MAGPRTVVLIPESTRKRPGGVRIAGDRDVARALPAAARADLEGLRAEVRRVSGTGIAWNELLPACERFDGNMYRHIPEEVWESRDQGVEVLIASGLLGLVASRDPVPRYDHSMAESTPPFGKLNRWWHSRGLPRILGAYLEAIRPALVVDLLSLEYREAVTGYEGELAGIEVRRIDFPGLGRASQPRRGEAVARILRTGKA